MTKRFLLVFLSVFGCWSASAQYTSRLGRFQVDQVKGCAPFTITITDANLVTTGECTPAKPCNMDFQGNNQQVQNQFTFTYTTPGTYRLSVLYQSIGSDDINVTVDQNIQPTYEIHACSGNRVSVKVTDNNYDQYVIDFNNDGAPETVIPFSNNAVAQHAYATPGTYDISVRGRDLSSADNCAASVKQFITRATLPAPTLNTLTTLGPTSVRLDFAVQNDIQYRLELAVNNSSTFQVFQSLYGVNTITVGNLLTETNYYCFRLSAYDPCANANTYSNVVCSQDFDVAFQNGVNQLNWRTSTAGISSVLVQRRDVDKNITTSTNIPGAPLTHQDVDYDCNTEYCYQLIMNYGAGITSTSLEKCGTAILQTTHPRIDNVSAVVGQGVQLSWTSDPLISIKEFDVWRSANGLALVRLSNTTAPSFSDPTYSTESALCYQVNYSDFCDNPSAEGIIACPIRLTGSLGVSNVISLSWTRYTGWDSGVQEYVLEKFDLSGGLIATYNLAMDTFFIDDQPDLVNQVVSYRVRVNPVEVGITPSLSNQVSFIKEMNLTFPTAFTPNQDELNDTFTITGQFVARMSISIFDRWGVMIFNSDSAEPWNGTRAGLPMPESAYIWKAQITDLAGRSFSREGTLILLRKTN